MSNKASLFKEYLTQQADNVFIDGLLNPDNMHLHKKNSNYQEDSQSQQSDDEDLERFKTLVKYYMKTDNEIKEIKSKMKLLSTERKKRQEIILSLSPSIMQYMTDNDIEELNSKDGKIEYKKSLVKSPLTLVMIKKKLYENFGNSVQTKAVIDKIYEEREKIEKQRLRRINH
jgi:hypothetical protein